MQFSNAIIITGCIASGKSTACKIIKNFGYNFVDADEISHQILDKNYQKIALEFGEEFVENKKVLRKKLGELLFNNKEKLKILEQILHPQIKSEILTQCKNLEKNNKIYFVDIPLFFERDDYKDFFKKIALVYAPKEAILKRLMSRNSLNKVEAKTRINLQMDIEEKKKLSTFIIDNSSNLEELNKNIENFLRSVDENFKIQC